MITLNNVTKTIVILLQINKCDNNNNKHTNNNNSYNNS